MKVKYETTNSKLDSPTKATGDEKQTTKKPAKKAANKKRKVEETVDDTVEQLVKDEEEE